MPKPHQKSLKPNMLDESNPLSFLPDGRSQESDFYKLQNRQKQLEAIANLDASSPEYAYLTDGTGYADMAAVGKGLQKLHEKDMIEIRALLYLQSLPDTSPELAQLKIMCGCSNREQIASFIADKQIKKLMMSQLEAITGRDKLQTMYNKQIVRGPNAFASLFS